MKRIYFFLLISLFSLTIFAQQIIDTKNFDEGDESTFVVAHPKPPLQVVGATKSWNVQFNYPLNSALSAQAGCETDGNFFYVTQWNGDSIFQYDMSGIFVGGFTISGANHIRDLAFDGTYFYGGSVGSTIYEMDFTAHTLISTINCPSSVEVRHISYDNINDGFWVGNWSTDINLISRTGTILSTILASTHGATSTYGSAFDNESNGGPFLWVISASTSSGVAEIKQIEIATGMQTGLVHDVLPDLGYSGIGGGLFIQSNIVQGTTTIGGLVQNSAIFGYDLSSVIDSFDVGIETFVPPQTGVGLSNSETISVEITNFGTETISGFPVNYEINGGTTVSETFTNSLVYGETVSFTFTQTADLSLVDEYEITVYTSMANDADINNNTISLTVFNLSNSSQRLALIEHFTQASCDPCASQNPALNALLTNAQNIDRVSHIAYHTSWPGFDPMFVFNDTNGLGDARVDFYEVSAVPNCVIAGNQDQGLPSIVTQDKIDAEYLRPGFFNISGTAEFINSELQIDLFFESYTNFVNGVIKAHAVLVEEVNYSSAPGSNGETFFPDVMRRMFPSKLGSDLNNPYDGDVRELNFTYEVQSPIDINNCKLIVFVQNDDNHEIYMAQQFAIEDLCLMSITVEATDITTVGVFGSANVSVSGGTAPYTYLWDDSNNQTTDTVINLQAGTYSVTVTDAIGCIQVDSVDISDFSAISDIENSSINIYPNPSNGILNIENISNTEIYIYNILGEQISHYFIKDENTSLDISNLSNGTYLLKLVTNEGTYSKQIFLNK